MNILQLVKNCQVEWKTLGEVAELKRGRVMSKEYLADNKGDYPVYSSQTANNGEIGKINTFDFKGEFVTWTTDGANAGTVFYRNGKFSITNVCGLIILNNNNQLNYKFIYYWLCIEAKKYVYSGMGNPKLMSNQMEKVKIPVPPLEIQQKIVQILDVFTAVTAELTAEYTLRQKQYQYYRDLLLDFDNLNNPFAKGINVEWKTLGGVAKKVSSGGTPLSTRADYYCGDIPWLRTQEVKFTEILETEIKITQQGLENSSAKWIPENCVIIAISGATAGRSAINKIPLTTNQHCCNIEVNEKIAHYRYVFHWVSSQYEKIKSLGQGARCDLNASIIKNYPIPTPDLEAQTQIVAILDKFDTLIHSISEGLPREIELRQKQYEYYRELLLGFDDQK